MATISQRITLEGADDIQKALQELGKAGEKAFKQIQDAAAKPITDPDAINKSKQAFDQLVQVVAKLSPQFKALTSDAKAFGDAGSQASQQVTAGLNQTNQAAQQAGTGLRTAAIGFGLAAAGIAAAVAKIVSSLTTGAGETAQQITDQASKLGISVAQMARLRTAMDAAGVSAQQFDAATVPLARNLAKLSLDTSGQQLYTFANGAKVVVQTMTQATPAAAAMVAELQKMGVSLRAIQTGDIELMMRQLATTIDRMPDGAQKAAAGAKFFGENWQKVVPIFAAGNKVIEDSVGVLGKWRIATRQMSTEQIRASKDAADQWEQFGKAIRAVKDQVGAMFAGTSFARAKWLTDMVDDARILLQTFLKLDEAGRAGFLQGLGQTGAELLFKTLLETGQLLASLWTGVLVPAGEALFEIFAKIAEALGGIPKSNVIAFFLTAAIAAAGLTLALKGIALLLTPLSLLLSTVFSPFGAALLVAAGAAALFWDKLKAGAASVAALIPAELAAIGDSIKKLFAGDFSGFWEQFSNAAIQAFQKIAAAAEQDQGVIGNVFAGIKQVIAALPGTIELVIGAFIGLGRAATAVAGAINTVFGTQLTGTDIAAIVIIGQMTGAFGLLAAAAVIASNAIAVLGTAFGWMVTAVAWATGLTAAVSGIIVVVALLAAALIALNWDTISAAAVAAWNAVTGAIGAAITAVGNFVSAMASIVWDSISSVGVAAWNAITGAINAAIDAIKSFLGLKGGGSVGEAAPASGFAGGGLLGGRGTGTSDSNLAWVSRGEHIMPARAVAQPGVLAFLEALRRSGGDLSRLLGGMGRFASGGLVTMPALAGGGLGGMSHVTIAFPGLPEITGLRASSGVVAELQRAAAMAQVRSGGRKPSRYT